MLEIPVISRIARFRNGIPLIVTVSGLVYGMFIGVLFITLKPTYATLLVAGTVTPFLMMFIGSSKHFLWVVLLLLLPVTLDFTIGHTGHLGGAAGWQISAFDAVLFVLYVMWILELVKKRTFTVRLVPEITIPALLLIGSAAISAINAKHIDLCVYELVEIIKMFFCFIYLANNIKTDKDIKLIIYVFIYCLFFEGFLGWMQHRTGEPLFPTALGGPSLIDDRVTGTWRSYNDFSWYLTFFLPIALCQMFSGWGSRFKIICFASLATGSAALAWTRGRSGWISFAVAAIFVFCFTFLKIENKKKIIKTFIAIITIVVLLVPLYPRLYNKVYGRFTADDKGSAESRWPQFKMAIDIWEDHLLIGAGLNNYTEIMEEYDYTDEGIFEITHFQVHNIFLQICAEMGLFGILAFLLFIFSIFYSGVIYIINNTNIDSYLTIGMLAGIIAFLLHGLFDALSLGGKMFSFVWTFAGILMASKYRRHAI